jgi:hypothetical protein
MIKRRLLVGVVFFVAAGLGVGLGVVSAARESSRAAHAATTTHHARTTTTARVGPATGRPVPQTLRFTSKTITSGYVDNKPAGLSAGDVLAQHSDWYQNGTKVGAMAVDSTVTQRMGNQTGEVMFTAVGRVKQGQIVMTGTFIIVPRNQTFDAAVTGGTGGFANARGYAVFDQVSADATKITLYLSR